MILTGAGFFMRSSVRCQRRVVNSKRKIDQSSNYPARASPSRIPNRRPFLYRLDLDFPDFPGTSPTLPPITLGRLRSSAKTDSYQPTPPRKLGSPEVLTYIKDIDLKSIKERYWLN